MTEVAATIKMKLFSDISQGHTDPEELAKRHGLNGHDLVKNLDQLRKQGLIELKWGAGERIERITLPRSRSVKDRVYNHLAGRSVMGAWVKAGPKQLNEDLGLVGNAGGMAVSHLLKEGKLEAKREGSRIVALRVPLSRPEVVVIDEGTGSTTVIDSHSTNGASSELPAPTPIRPTMPPTPNLDAYFSARRIARLAPAHNPYLTVEFTENPIAEEALVLRESLARVLDKR